MRDHDDLLDIGEAAAFLGVSETSLRRWTNAGRLPCLRIGRRRERRFRRVDLLAFAEHQPADAPPEAAARVGNGPGGHLLGLYGSDGGRTDLAASFFAEAFLERRACFFVASPEAHDAVSHRLRERHPIAKSRIDAGDLVSLEFVGSVAGQIDEIEARIERALRRGATSCCLVGDAAGVKRSAKIDGLIDYEACYDQRVSRRRPIVTLCLYDVRAFSTTELLGALKLHPDTFRHSIDRLFA
jgi:transcriptional repressor of dcmA and dcmR